MIIVPFGSSALLFSGFGKKVKPGLGTGILLCVPEKGNKSSIRVLDDIRLVARPTLKVGMPHAAHVLLLAALGYSGRQCAAAICQNGQSSRGIMLCAVRAFA